MLRKRQTVKNHRSFGPLGQLFRSDGRRVTLRPVFFRLRFPILPAEEVFLPDLPDLFTVLLLPDPRLTAVLPSSGYFDLPARRTDRVRGVSSGSDRSLSYLSAGVP